MRRQRLEIISVIYVNSCKSLAKCSIDPH